MNKEIGGEIPPREQGCITPSIIVQETYPIGSLRPTFFSGAAKTNLKRPSVFQSIPSGQWVGNSMSGEFNRREVSIPALSKTTERNINVIDSVKDTWQRTDLLSVYFFSFA